MPNLISFSLTEQQFLDGSKDVTRRMAWQYLNAGDHLIAVRKCMGLKAGEKVHRLGRIEVTDVRREPLKNITAVECRREGFPDMSPAEFIAFFCKTHPGCHPDSEITRIAYRRISTATSEKANDTN